MKFLVIISIFSLTDATRRIYGGTEIDIKTVPYQAGVIFQRSLSCGGSFLSRKFVISAAHCQLKVPNFKKLYKITGGSNEFSNELSTYFEVEDIITHPKYDAGENYDFDFGFFRIADVEDFPEVIKFIALPKPDEPIVEGEMMIVAGWGSIGLCEDITPRKLQGATIPIADQEKCSKIYVDKTSIDSNATTLITDRMVCAGYGVVGSVRPGDSGGPLATANREMPVLIGITSWGEPSSSKGHPNVFSKVSSVLPWINEVMSEEY